MKMYHHLVVITKAEPSCRTASRCKAFLFAIDEQRVDHDRNAKQHQYQSSHPE
jgi:hypothetical protein